MQIFAVSFYWDNNTLGIDFLLQLPPPRVDFTQPSPPVGVAVPHAPDSPWDANMILEEQQGKKNKDKKKVKEADLEEERRKQRSCFPLRTVPVALEATVAANVSTDEAGGSLCVYWRIFGVNSQQQLFSIQYMQFRLHVLELINKTKRKQYDHQDRSWAFLDCKR